MVESVEHALQQLREQLKGASEPSDVRSHAVPQQARVRQPCAQVQPDSQSLSSTDWFQPPTTYPVRGVLEPLSGGALEHMAPPAAAAVIPFNVPSNLPSINAPRTERPVENTGKTCHKVSAVTSVALDLSNPFLLLTRERSFDSQPDVEAKHPDASTVDDCDDDTGHMLSKQEIIELDQHEGVSFVRSERFPYFYIMPRGTAGMAWEFLVLMLVLLQAVTIPLDAAFNHDLLGWGELAILVIFAFDIVVNFMMPVEDGDGNLMLSYAKIARRYATSYWFPLDIVSCIPFTLFAGGTSSLKLFRLLRLARVSKIVK